MAIEQWSQSIVLVDLADEPQFSEDMAGLAERLGNGRPAHVVFNLAAVRHFNSSNISQLLRTRQTLVAADRRLILCSVPDAVWGVMLVTGLDKVFEFSPDVPSALASLQLIR